MEGCDHPGTFGGLCVVCGQDVTRILREREAEAGRAAAEAARKGKLPGPVNTASRDTEMVAAVGWGNQSTKLLMSRKEMATVSREIDEKRLLAGRRLALVVDLDKTILHTTTSLVAEEWARTWRASITELGPTASNGLGSRMFTRLRPGLAEFLEAVHKLFEMQVFTFGTRRYAEEILKLVDPTKKYFASRILTRDESFSARDKTQNLEVLFPQGYRLVAIIDDSSTVWNHSPNLLPAPPYEYFGDLEGEVNLNVGDKGHAVHLSPGELAANAVRIPDEYRAELEALHGSVAGTALADAFLAELRAKLETEAEPDVAALSADAAGVLGCPADCAKWLADARAAPASEPPPPGYPDSVNLAVEHVALLFPQKGRKVAVVNGRVCVDCEVTPREGDDQAGRGDGDGGGSGGAPSVLNDRQLALLAAHVECLVQVATVTPVRRTAYFGPSVSDAIARRDETRAVWLVKERLYWQQPRAAAALLMAFRVLLPSRFWFADDTTVLRQYTSELALQGGTRRLVLRPPPTDDDRGLDQMLQVLTAMHTEFFRRHDEHSNPDVADVFADLRPRFPEYPMWALCGTKLAFSGIIKRGADPRRSEMWIRSVQMGAFVAENVEPDTTHLITKSPPTTDKCKLAKQIPGCRIVDVQWLRECFDQQRRVDDTPFLLADVLEPSAVAGDSETGVGLGGGGGAVAVVDRTLLDEMDAEVAALLEGDDEDDDDDGDDDEGEREEEEGGHEKGEEDIYDEGDDDDDDRGRDDIDVDDDDVPAAADGDGRSFQRAPVPRRAVTFASRSEVEAAKMRALRGDLDDMTADGDEYDDGDDDNDKVDEGGWKMRDDETARRPPKRRREDDDEIALVASSDEGSDGDDGDDDDDDDEFARELLSRLDDA